MAGTDFAVAVDAEEGSGNAEEGSGTVTTLAWLNAGHDYFVCEVCGKDDVETNFTNATHKKSWWLGPAGMQRRKHRCAECGKAAGAANLARQQKQRPRPSSPDQCCHTDESGRRCSKTLVPGEGGNVSDSQWKRKNHGDRRCTECAREHAKRVNRERRQT